MTEREFVEAAAAYALGALTPAERLAFERACAAHPEWASRLSGDLEAAASLADGVPEEEPRPEVRERLFAELDARIAAGEPPSAMRMPEEEGSATPGSVAGGGPATGRGGSRTESPEAASRVVTPRGEYEFADAEFADELRTSRSRSLLTRVLAVVATVALIAGVGSGLLIALQPPPPPGVAALERVQGARDAQQAAMQVPGGGEAMLVWSESQGTAVLLTAGLPAAPSGHTYELWYVRGEERIPAGTFDPDERGAATVLVAGEMHEGDTVAVTVEVLGGAPDGVPSDQLVFAIPTGSSGTST